MRASGSRSEIGETSRLPTVCCSFTRTAFTHSIANGREFLTNIFCPPNTPTDAKGIETRIHPHVAVPEIWIGDTPTLPITRQMNLPDLQALKRGDAAAWDESF